MVKISYLSNRFQRFENCVVKEGDIEIAVRLTGVSEMPHFPVRVVVNPRTLTIFTTTSYGAVYKSFDLYQMSIRQFIAVDGR